MPEENSEQPVALPQVKIEYVVPDPEVGLFTTYANDVRLTYTIFDVRMVFGEIVDVMSDKIVVEQRAQVTVSYLQAKLLLNTLNQAIAQHETTFGELKLPAEVATNFLVVQGMPTPGTSFRK
jgi:hypothetical protein